MAPIYSLLLTLVLGLAPVTLAHETDKVHEEPSGAAPTTSDVKSRLREKYKGDLAAARAAKEAYKASKRTGSVAEQLAAVKEYSQQMIAVRLKILASYPKRLDGKRCSAADLEAISNSIAASQAILNSATVGLAAATEVKQAKEIINEAIWETRVIAVWAPAVNGLCRSSRLNTLIDGRPTEAANVLKVAGQDVGPLLAHLAQAKAAATAAHEIYRGLVAAPSYPDTAPAKAEFTKAKSKLNEAKSHLNEAKAVIKELKAALESRKSPPPEKTEATP